MNVLVTGGGGFIGYHLARYHAERGDSVVILDNLSKSQGRIDRDLRDLLGQANVKLFTVDLTHPIDVSDLGALDTVYHLAAINGTQLFYEIPYQLARANLLMTLNLLDWLQGAKIGRLLYSSTSEVYAGGEALGILKLPTDETAAVAFPQPTDKRFSYGASKFMGEFLCLQFGNTFGTPVSVVRYHNIYGPRMGKEHVVPEFILRANRHEDSFKIYGGGETRAFCYVADAVEAMHRVATSAACDQQIVHVGRAVETKIEQLARLVMKLMNVDLHVRELGRRSGSVSRRCPDVSKLKALTGFEAKVSLEQGLQQTIEWYVRSV